MNAAHKLAYWRAEKQYKQMLEEGYDIVLPPEPLFPASYSYAQRQGNYPIEKAALQQFVDTVVAKHGINQKIFVLTIDTGAKSRSKWIKKNFVDTGIDNTGENNPMDEHGHFSFCQSQISGLYGETPLGALAMPGLPDDFWLWSGEKGLQKRGGATFGMLNRALERALKTMNEYAAKGYKCFLNCSWGGGGYNEEMNQIFTAIRDAGHFSFVSAGNSGQNGVNNPGNLPPDKIGHLLLTIGAVDREDKVAYFSSRGPEVEFVSYGVNNLGAAPTETGLKTGSGTSYSGPFALGCAALLTATFPEIENMNDLFYVLREGATDLGTSGKDNNYGHGLIRMDQYAEDDLPGDDPDNPGDDPDDPGDNPGDNPDDPGDDPGNPVYPVMPARSLLTEIPGEYTYLWATLGGDGLSGLHTLLPGIEVLGDMPIPINLDELDEEIIAQMTWRKLTFSNIKIFSNAITEASQQWVGRVKPWAIDYFTRRRGVAVPYPCDPDLAGQWGLYFTRMHGNNDNNEIAALTATVTDHLGNSTEVVNMER